jgi:histidine triad (HIT) family protein
MLITEDCIFCKIASGMIPTGIIFRNDEFTVFNDSNPVAPVHILVIPNRHIDSTCSITEEETGLVGRLILIAKNIAVQQGLEESGFRMVINTGPDAGQSVFHLHLHILGGRRLPPLV